MSLDFSWAAAPSTVTGGRFLLVTSKDGVVVAETPLAKPIIVMGRNADRCDIVLDHASISRQHCALVQSREGELFVVDLGSSHGTFLNGRQLKSQEKALFRADGADVLTVGGSTRSYTAKKRQRDEKEEEEEGDDGPALPSLGKRGEQDGESGWFEAPSSSSSSSSASISRTSQPKVLLPAVSAASAANTGAISAEASAEFEAAEAAAKAEARRKREAEIAAAVASMSGSAPPPSVANFRPPPSTAQSGNNEEEDHDYDDDDNDGEEEEARAAALAMGLPVAFGGGARVGGGGARGAGKRKQPPPTAGAPGEEVDDEEGDAEPRAKRARYSGQGDGNDEDDEDGDDRGGADLGSVAARLGLPVSHEAVLSNAPPGSSSSSSASSSSAVTTIAVDPSGGRIITACSADYSLRLFDFGGMDQEHRPFRDLVPEPGQPVACLAYSNTGDRFLVSTGGAKIRLYDREGKALSGTTIKGDMYLADLSMTKGHPIGPVTGLEWHPSSEDTFISASLDSTVRLWNLTAGKRIFDELCCTEVIKCKTSKGQRAGVTALALQKKGAAAAAAATAGSSTSSHYCGLLAAGCDDGSVQFFNLRSSLAAKYTRPDLCIRDAHCNEGGAGAAVSSVSFSPDGIRVATRGQWDDCVKIWDVRKVTQPLATITNIPTVHANANTAWSPDGSLLLVGADVKKGAGKDGLIYAFEVSELESKCSKNNGGAGMGARGGISGGSASAVDASEASSYTVNACPGAAAVVVHWHPKLNQLFVGCGDGHARVLYSPSLSTKGALLSSARAPKRRELQDAIRSSSSSAGYGRIIVPNALPMYREGLDDRNLPLHLRPKLTRDEKKAQQEKRMAASAAASGGGMAPAADAPPPADEPAFLHTKKSTFTDFYVKNVIMKGGGAGGGGEDGQGEGPRNLRAEDPAAVLRKYAAAGKAVDGSSSSGTGGAGGGTVFAAKTLEEELEEEKRRIETFLHGNVTGGQ